MVWLCVIDGLEKRHWKVTHLHVIDNSASGRVKSSELKLVQFPDDGGMPLTISQMSSIYVLNGTEHLLDMTHCSIHCYQEALQTVLELMP